MVRVNVTRSPPRPAPARTNSPPHNAGATVGFSTIEELERLTNTCLLGEQTFYVNGQDIEATMRKLVGELPVGDLPRVAEIAVSARLDLGLRHAPLLLLVALAERRAGGPMIRAAAAKILRTPRDCMDLWALYQKDHNPQKRAWPHAFRAAAMDGFHRWSDYQIRKYATLSNVRFRLRTLLRASRPKPADLARAALLKEVVADTVTAPDTWEALLSVPDADERAVWERLLTENKLGALALVRNLRNMHQVSVNPDLVAKALAVCKADDVWPWQALAAAREAPHMVGALNDLMVRSAGRLPRVPGRTVVLVDVSGSMDANMSDRGTMKRMDAAAGLAAVLREACEDIRIASFSNDLEWLRGSLPHGVPLANAIVTSQSHGGTALARAVERAAREEPTMARLIVVTDEQGDAPVNMPPEARAYIVNLAPTKRGIEWAGEVRRISGWSAGIVRFLAADILGAMPALPAPEDEAEEA